MGKLSAKGSPKWDSQLPFRHCSLKLMITGSFLMFSTIFFLKEIWILISSYDILPFNFLVLITATPENLWRWHINIKSKLFLCQWNLRHVSSLFESFWCPERVQLHAIINALFQLCISSIKMTVLHQRVI